MFVVWTVWVRAGWGLRPWIGQLVVLRCGAGWLVVCGVGNTPAVVGWRGCCGRGGFAGWWVPPACVGGGMLSGFWGSAPWLPGPCFCCLFVGGGVWVWVGWL